ncbi:MAG: polysaccharide deacetylase family protein [Cellulophaga sp.]
MSISEKLGFSKNTKLLIIHADDAGLANAENLATITALEKGLVNSYSIMVPCPWFFEMAAFASKEKQYDCGIHLTLTCEWKHYKFGPVLPASEVPSLVDKQGYFHRSREEFKANATVTDVKKELKAQIERALEYGISPTHLDSHMYTLGVDSIFLQVYKELGIEYNLPILLNKTFLDSFGIDTEKHLSSSDFCVDKVVLGHYDYFEKGELANYYEDSLNSITEGLNMILIHPALDNQEMQAIAINHPNFGSKWRQIDLDFFTSEKCRSLLLKNNIQLITWRDIQLALHT